MSEEKPLWETEFVETDRVKEIAKGNLDVSLLEAELLAKEVLFYRNVIKSAEIKKE